MFWRTSAKLCIRLWKTLVKAELTVLRREFSLVVALTGLKDIRSDRETSKLKHDGRTWSLMRGKASLVEMEAKTLKFKLGDRKSWISS